MPNLLARRESWRSTRQRVHVLHSTYLPFMARFFRIESPLAIDRVNSRVECFGVGGSARNRLNARRDPRSTASQVAIAAQSLEGTVHLVNLISFMWSRIAFNLVSTRSPFPSHRIPPRDQSR
jgi:hypothetical protein